VSNSARLLDKYRNRWWNQSIGDTYFACITLPGNKFKPGEQLYAGYGSHSNSYFLEK
jgi:hypothetical protein